MHVTPESVQQYSLIPHIGYLVFTVSQLRHPGKMAAVGGLTQIVSTAQLEY